MMLKKCFLPKYLGNFHRHFQTSSIVCKEKRWKEKSVLPFQSELKNPVAEVYGGIEHWPADKVKKCLKFRNNLSFSTQIHLPLTDRLYVKCVIKKSYYLYSIVQFFKMIIRIFVCFIKNPNLKSIYSSSYPIFN